MATPVQNAWYDFLPTCSEMGKLTKGEQDRLFGLLKDKVAITPNALAKDESDWNDTLKEVGITSSQDRGVIKIGLRKLQAPPKPQVDPNNNNALQSQGQGHGQNLISSKQFTPNAKKMFDRSIDVDELRKMFSDMDAKLSKIVPRSSEGPTTFADWWSKNKPHSQEDFIPEAAQNFFDATMSCESGLSETDIVQPLWHKICKKFQKNRKFADLIKQQPTSRHNVPSIGTRKPDGPFFIVGMPQSEFYLSVVGEMKGGVTAGFAAEHFGHLASFLAALLDLTVRSFVYGFLFDGYNVQFMEAKLEHGQFIISRLSPPHRVSGSGGKRLTWLMCAPPADLGFGFYQVTFKGEAVHIQKVLGRGTFAIAYSAVLRGEDIVVKIYSNSESTTNSMRHENEILQMLAALTPSVPQIIGLSDSQDALLLKPVAHPFFSPGHGKKDKDMVELKSVHVCHLVGVLEAAHNMRIIHRDVKIPNFFSDPTDANKVMLNDWASAHVESDEEVMFVGTLLYAPDCLLEGLIGSQFFSYIPSRHHDLISVVKCLYLSFHPFIVDTVNITKPEQVLQLWDGRLKYGIWAKLVEYATACDYRSLQKLIIAL